MINESFSERSTFKHFNYSESLVDSVIKLFIKLFHNRSFTAIRRYDALIALINNWFDCVRLDNSQVALKLQITGGNILHFDGVFVTGAKLKLPVNQSLYDLLLISYR